MVEIDGEGRIVAINHQMQELLGLGPKHKHQPRSHFQDLVHADDRQVLASYLTSTTEPDGASRSFRVRIVTTRGIVRWVDLSLAVLPSVSDATAHRICFVVDVSEAQHLEEEVGLLRDHDPLTGLFTRPSFCSEVSHRLATIPGGGRSSLVVFDIDDFGSINSEYGLDAGDEVLIAIGTVLKDRLRESDVIGRTNGDEFMIFLTHTDEDRAAHVADVLARDIRNQVTIPSEGRMHQFSVSAAVAPVTAATDLRGTLTDTLRRANEARRQGGQNIGAGAQAHLEHTVGGELDDDRFVLLAQPIVDLASNTTSHLELFVRFRNPDGDLVPAAAFIDAAERHGRVGRIDRWVLQHAIDLAVSYPDEQMSFHVNISGQSLSDPHLMVFIESAIKDSGLDPHRLVLEVSETAPMFGSPFAAGFSDFLVRIGCQLALDHVGLDSGGLRYVSALPFDYLKIDGSFVTHCLTSKSDRLIIDAIVSIANGLDRQTVACSVEDAATLDYLRSRGVDFAQGYGLGGLEELFQP